MPKVPTILLALMLLMAAGARAQAPDDEDIRGSGALFASRAAAGDWQRRHLAAGGDVHTRVYLDRIVARMGVGGLLPHAVRLPACPGCDFGMLLLCRTPLGGVAGLKGRALRTVGGDHSPLLRHGAREVKLPVSEVRRAAEIGALDCIGHVAEF